MSQQTLENAPTNFIVQRIESDLEQKKYPQGIITRFPPEPNGYLHIGHAKSIVLNFGLAKQFNGRCHLRFDDTNPVKEDPEYVRAIQEDIHWLGFDWGEHLYHASEYFPALYQHALTLINKGLAYVCDLSADEMRQYRGTLKEAGKNSPYRERSVQENLELFEKMKKGEFEDGSRTLRAKIDMASDNLNLRDPAIYRIKKVEHHQTGDEWCIYPMYDFAHALSDAQEHITHSICSLEFENHRPLYEWFIEQVDAPSEPKQIEFNRLNLYYTVMSKRKLNELVTNGIVEGWDDPRLPTIRGLRRRGFTPESIRSFCNKIGLSKSESWSELSYLEECLRQDLNPKVKRFMGVIDPIKVVITNYPEGQVEMMKAPYFPDEPDKFGYRDLPFSREIYIERDDFMENPYKKFYRLYPGNEVRLRRAYYITCQEVIKDENGEIIEVHCTYDPESKGGSSPDGRRVKGTLHWVCATHAVDAKVRLYESLFTDERPDSNKEKDYTELINPNSLVEMNSKMEPSIQEIASEEPFQLERKGYFVLDSESQSDRLVINRSVTLKDSWARFLKQQKKK